MQNTPRIRELLSQVADRLIEVERLLDSPMTSRPQTTRARALGRSMTDKARAAILQELAKGPLLRADMIPFTLEAGRRALDRALKELHTEALIHYTPEGWTLTEASRASGEHSA